MSGVTRRRFLAESTRDVAAGASAMTFTATAARAQSASDKVVLGLVGSGGRGRGVISSLAPACKRRGEDGL